MNIYYAVLAGVLTAAAVAVAVWVVLTLIELRDAARELEALVHKANNEMDKIESVTNAVAGVAGAVGGSMGKTLFSVTSLLFQAVQGFRRRRSPRADEPVAEAVEEEDDER